MRPSLPVLLTTVALVGTVAASCGGSTAVPSPTPTTSREPSPTTAPLVPTSTRTTQTPEPSTSSPTPAPVALPPGVPPTYAPDEAAGDVPPEALVPRNATVTSSSFANLPDGSTAIVVTYARGPDPFSQEHGFVVWRRFAARPHWRATYGFRDPARAGVLGITVDLADATGDGAPDALALESSGGTGNCAVVRLVQLSTGRATEIEPPGTCDTQVGFSTDPVGLTVITAIFKAGDPHCCPHSFRITQLEWDGSGFHVTGRTTSPAP